MAVESVEAYPSTVDGVGRALMAVENIDSC